MKALSRCVNNYFDHKIDLQELKKLAQAGGFVNHEIIQSIFMRDAFGKTLRTDEARTIVVEHLDPSTFPSMNEQKTHELALDILIVNNIREGSSKKSLPPRSSSRPETTAVVSPTRATLSPTSRRPLPRGMIGFRAPGWNTCFVNAGLQCLLSRPSYKTALQTQCLKKRIGESRTSFTQRTQLLRAMQSLAKGEKVSESLRIIVSSPLFRDKGLRLGILQEDAQEFISYLNDFLDMDHREDFSLVCQTLRHAGDMGSTEEVGPAMRHSILSLKVDQPHHTISMNTLFTRSTIAPIRIADGQILSYHLSHPNISLFSGLTVHIAERFSAHRRKSHIPITGVLEPIMIDVKDQTTEAIHQVKLIPQSIVCHTGSSIHSGHYVTIEKREGRWFLKDDAYVREITEEEALTRASRECYLVNYEAELT